MNYTIDKNYIDEEQKSFWFPHRLNEVTDKINTLKQFHIKKWKSIL